MIDWIALHPHWAALAVFLVSLGESLVVVGWFIPGTLVMFAVGALVAAGALDLWATILWAAAGAVAGDGISYWLGRHYRERRCSLRLLRRYPAVIRRGEAFFRRHGGKSVLLGRFIGPVRPMIPAVAGMLGMPPLRFCAVNVLSALAWAPAYILPGVAFGASVKLAGAVAARLAVMLTALVLGVWFAVWATKRLALWLPPRVSRGLAALHERAAASPRPGWVRRRIVELLDPARPAFRALLPLAAVFIAAAWVFGGVLEDVLTRDPLVRVDSAVYYLLQGMRTPLGDAGMIILTELGDASVTVPVLIAVLLWLMFRRAWRTAGYWLAAAGFAALLVPAIKAGLRLPRPLPRLYDGPYGFAFPSSHATMSLVVYGFLAVLLAHGLPVRRRWPVYGVAVPLIALIAFSRLYLGAHWMSDVIGGLALGTAWIALLGVAYVRHRPPALPAGTLAAVSLLTLLTAGALHVAMRFSLDTERYAVRQALTTLAARDWWEGGWRRLPAWRLDLEGQDEQPLTVQWAGPPDALREALRGTAWQEASALSARNWPLLFDTARPAMQLPVLPRVHDGRNQALALIRPVAGAADQRLVLRLWASRTVLGDRAQPVWIGTVTQETIRRPLAWFNLPHDGEDYNGPREELRAAVAGVDVREVMRSDLVGSQERSSLWDGRVLLARVDLRQRSAAQNWFNGVTHARTPRSVEAAVAVHAVRFH